MAVLSTLLRVSSLANAFKGSIIAKGLVSKHQNAFKQAFRNMSGGDEDRTMYITPTRYQYTCFKDNLHFYFTIGIVPLGLLILYCNIFIGPATLTEIPEGYEPKHWEYYKHPISRFIAKYFFDDPQITYEQTLHYLYDCQQKFDWSKTIEKAKYLMATRDDYKAWYFFPSDQGRHYRYARKLHDELEESRGYE